MPARSSIKSSDLPPSSRASRMLAASPSSRSCSGGVLLRAWDNSEPTCSNGLINPRLGRGKGAGQHFADHGFGDQPLEASMQLLLSLHL